MSSPHPPGQGYQLTSNSNDPENRPSRSRDDINTNACTVSKDGKMAENNALVVADAAVRKAIRALRDAHKVRDNIIQHRKAFLQRREEARKDFDIVQQSIMDALNNNPDDTTGGRTTVQWESAYKHYRDMMDKALNVFERAYWYRMSLAAHYFSYHRRFAAGYILFAEDKLKTWEKEKFELRADKELERAR
jgi:hypothetical protein